MMSGRQRDGTGERSVATRKHLCSKRNQPMAAARMVQRFMVGLIILDEKGERFYEEFVCVIRFPLLDLLCKFTEKVGQVSFVYFSACDAIVACDRAFAVSMFLPGDDDTAFPLW